MPAKDRKNKRIAVGTKLLLVVSSIWAIAVF